MHRILSTIALLALAPACVHAQAAPPKAEAPAPAQAAPRKSHNPFGAAMLELTRAAREQAAAKAAPAEPAATTTTREATKPVQREAPVLADSNRS